MSKLQSYDDVMASLAKKKRTPHLLLGNGFSMSYDRDIFSYNALYNFIEKIDDPILKKLFEVTKTQNFEVVMQQLDATCRLLEAFASDKDLIERIENTSQTLKNSLVNAVQSMHPEHVFKIDESERRKCAEFLSPYLEQGGHVFSTNYDLLLYWVEVSSEELDGKCIDGFGKDRLNEDEPHEDPVYSELIWGPNRSEQNIHHLHGTLSIFDEGVYIVKEIYDGNYLLENIKARMQSKQYPVFVASGNGDDKLNVIKHNPYLTACYDTLSSVEGSLITFGFSFGDSDDHIIDAINLACSKKRHGFDKLWSVYIGVYDDTAKQHIESIKHKFQCKVNLFDAKTVSIWR